MLPDQESIPAFLEDADQISDGQALVARGYEAVEHARRYDQPQLAQAMSNLVRLLVRQGQNEQACSIAREILEIEQNSNNAVEALLALGMCSAKSGSLNEAEAHFQRAIEISRNTGFAMGIARSTEYLAGQVLLVRGQFPFALTLLEEAGILSEEKGTRHWYEIFLRCLMHEILGDRRHSRQMLDELVVQVEPGTRLAAAYYFLWARLAIDEEDLEQAREYLRLALRVASRTSSLELNLWIRLEFSHFFRLKNEANTARSWAMDALSISRRYGLSYFTALALIETAQANWDTGDEAAAETYLSEALQILGHLGDAYDHARACFIRAVWHKQAGRPHAEKTWLEAVTGLVRGGYVFILEKEQAVAFPMVAYWTRSKTPEVRQATEGLLRHLANVPPPALRIATLGQFSVWKGQQRLADQAWTRRKAGELFRYLLLQPGRASGREVIIEALWPDHPSENPGDLLHQATSALRHVLEPDLPDKFPSRYLRVEGDHIALALPPGSVVDFDNFERALPQAIRTHNIDRLLEALNLYSGELFPSDRYTDWSAEKRQGLAELRQRGLLALAQSYLLHNQWYNTINCCRQVLNADAWNEDAVHLAMQAYAGLQDIPHALQIYMQLEQILKKELDIAPRSDLRELANRLRTR